MTLARLARGRFGEDLAARWYRRHGYRVLDRNWRCREGELDLVAVRGTVVVFCEVKARATTSHGHPSEAVGPAKQRRLRRLAMRWLAEARADGRVAATGLTLRFDVACVLGTRIHVIESAF